MGAASIVLPQQLDGTSSAALRASLLDARGGPIVLDGSGVTRFGALGLQVLLSGARTWADDGHAFQLLDASPALSQGLRLLGASIETGVDQGAAS